jgi:hypothetical protein
VVDSKFPRVIGIVFVLVKVNWSALVPVIVMVEIVILLPPIFVSVIVSGSETRLMTYSPKLSM